MKYTSVIAALLVSSTSAAQYDSDYKLRAVLGALAGDSQSSGCGCNVCPCQAPAAPETHVSSKAAEKAAAERAAATKAEEEQKQKQQPRKQN